MLPAPCPHCLPIAAALHENGGNGLRPSEWGLFVIASLSKRLHGPRDECRVLSFIIKASSLEPWLYRLVTPPTLPLELRRCPRLEGCFTTLNGCILKCWWKFSTKDAHTNYRAAHDPKLHSLNVTFAPTASTVHFLMAVITTDVSCEDVTRRTLQPRYSLSLPTYINQNTR